MQIQPYLYFDGQSDEAIEFYKQPVGARVNMLMRFKDSPEPVPDMNPQMANKVMHGSLQIGDSTVLISDGRCRGAAKLDGFALTLLTSSQDIDRIFSALADGGKVQMPLAKTFFSPRFGMLSDRFGVQWILLVQH